MSWLLFDATARAQVRRLRSAARRAPLATATATAAWALSPVLAVRAGGRVAEILAPVLADARLARAVVIGLVLPAAAAGAAVALASPGVAALGGSVASAPVSCSAAYAAVVLPRLILTTVLVAPPVVATVVTVCLPSPGGVPAAAGVLAVLAASTATGGLVAESVLRLVRRVSIPIGLGVPAVGAAAICAASELAARGLSGSVGSAVGVATAGSMLGVATGALWLVVASGRPSAVVRRRVRTRRRVLPPVEASALAVLVRAPDIRPALVTALCFGAVSLALGALAAEIGPAVLLASGVAALGAALAPLSAAGKVSEGRWLWSVGRPLRITVGWLAATAAAVLAVIGPLVGAGVLAGAAVAALHGTVIAIVAWAAGIAAGALVPRRSPSLADDAAVLAAFVAVASVGVSGIAGVQEVMARVGAPGLVGTALALGLWCALAGVLQWRRVGGA